jgi:hypothetical protein
MPVCGGAWVACGHQVEVQRPTMESGEANKGGGVARWWTRIAEMNKFTLEGKDDARSVWGRCASDERRHRNQR